MGGKIRGFDNLGAKLCDHVGKALPVVQDLGGGLDHDSPRFPTSVVVPEWALEN